MSGLLPRVSGTGRDFLKLWSATTVSRLGDGITIVALPFYVTTRTDSALAVGGLQVALALGLLVWSLPAGRFADTTPRRTAVLVGADIARAGLLAVLAAVALFDGPVATAYAVAFLAASATCFYETAVVAVVPSVAPGDLVGANTRLELTDAAALHLAGPLLGGVLAAISVPLSLWLDAGSFVVSALLLAGLTTTARRTQVPVPGTSVGYAEAFVFLRSDRILQVVAWCGAAANVAAAAVTGLLVYVVTNGYQGGAVSAGVIYASTAVGAVGGPALVPRLVRALGTGRAFLVGVALTGFGAALIGLIRVPAGGAIGATLAIAGIGILNVTQFTLRQERTPDGLLGRVSGVLRSGFFIAFAAGGFAASLLADTAGVFTAQLAVGGAVVAVALAGCLTPLGAKSTSSA